MKARAARLIWKRPDGHELSFSLEPRTLIVGRDEEADLRVDEALVSRQHARLEPREEGWLLTDLGSTNYTRVNGDVITERQLEDGDEVRFARAQCRFEMAPRPAEDEDHEPTAIVLPIHPADQTVVDAVTNDGPAAPPAVEE